MQQRINSDVDPVQQHTKIRVYFTWNISYYLQQHFPHVRPQLILYTAMLHLEILQKHWVQQALKSLFALDSANIQDNLNLEKLPRTWPWQLGIRTQTEKGGPFKGDPD